LFSLAPFLSPSFPPTFGSCSANSLRQFSLFECDDAGEGAGAGPKLPKQVLHGEQEYLEVKKILFGVL
jgi:hypothetical protein